MLLVTASPAPSPELILPDLLELAALERKRWSDIAAPLAGSDVLVNAIVSTDILLRLSGGAANTSPAAALGAAMSTAGGGIIAPGTLNNLWDDVAAGEAAAGDTEYRCVYVHNNHGSLTHQLVAIWIDDQPNSSTAFALGLDPAAIGANSAITIANESTAPSGVTFSTPTSKGTGLLNADIPAGSKKALWIRRTVSAGAGALNPDSGSVRAEGDTAP